MGYKQQMAKVENTIRPAIEITCAAHHDNATQKFAVNTAVKSDIKQRLSL